MELLGLPIGSMVVPFWRYLIGSSIYIYHKKELLWSLWVKSLEVKDAHGFGELRSSGSCSTKRWLHEQRLRRDGGLVQNTDVI